MVQSTVLILETSLSGGTRTDTFPCYGLREWTGRDGSHSDTHVGLHPTRSIRITHWTRDHEVTHSPPSRLVTPHLSSTTEFMMHLISFPSLPLSVSQTSVEWLTGTRSIKNLRKKVVDNLLPQLSSTVTKPPFPSYSTYSTEHLR